MSGQEPLEIQMAGVKFYSAQDELYFFTWLKSIGSVCDVFSQGRAIYALLIGGGLRLTLHLNSYHFSVAI